VAGPPVLNHRDTTVVSASNWAVTRDIVDQTYQLLRVELKWFTLAARPLQYRVKPADDQNLDLSSSNQLMVMVLPWQPDHCNHHDR
jgi:hypothetical protein